jgi:hypothetical protein
MAPGVSTPWVLPRSERRASGLRFGNGSCAGRKFGLDTSACNHPSPRCRLPPSRCRSQARREHSKRRARSTVWAARSRIRYPPVAQTRARCWRFIRGTIVRGGCSSNRSCSPTRSFGWLPNRRARHTRSTSTRRFMARSASECCGLASGVPPATTGGFARVAELSPKRLVLPDATAAGVAICARIAACGLREGVSPVAPTACARESAKLGSCSAAADCAEVVRCVGTMSR